MALPWRGLGLFSVIAKSALGSLVLKDEVFEGGEGHGANSGNGAAP